MSAEFSQLATVVRRQGLVSSRLRRPTAVVVAAPRPCGGGPGLPLRALTAAPVEASCMERDDSTLPTKVFHLCGASRSSSFDAFAAAVQVSALGAPYDATSATKPRSGMTTATAARVLVCIDDADVLLELQCAAAAALGSASDEETREGADAAVAAAAQTPLGQWLRSIARAADPARGGVVVCLGVFDGNTGSSSRGGASTGLVQRLVASMFPLMASHTVCGSLVPAQSTNEDRIPAWASTVDHRLRARVVDCAMPQRNAGLDAGEGAITAGGGPADTGVAHSIQAFGALGDAASGVGAREDDAMTAHCHRLWREARVAGCGAALRALLEAVAVFAHRSRLSRAESTNDAAATSTAASLFSILRADPEDGIHTGAAPASRAESSGEANTNQGGGAVARAVQPPSGVLLYGMEDDGRPALVARLAAQLCATTAALRTTAAAAAAPAAAAPPFLFVDAPRLFAPYLGETEGRLRAAFKAARDAAAASQCGAVLIIRGIDAIGAARSAAAGAGGAGEGGAQVLQRVLAALLIEADGVASAGAPPLLLVGTCGGRPMSALDAALTRPGRLERIVALTPYAVARTPFLPFLHADAATGDPTATAPATTTASSTGVPPSAATAAAAALGPLAPHAAEDDVAAVARALAATLRAAAAAGDVEVDSTAIDAAVARWVAVHTTPPEDSTAGGGRAVLPLRDVTRVSQQAVEAICVATDPNAALLALLTTCIA